jgi:hypothetical protein
MLMSINSREAITQDQCSALDGTENTMHLCEAGPSGFLGVYNPPTSEVLSLFMANVKDPSSLSFNASIDSNQYTGRRRLLAASSLNSTFTGIQNPVACLLYGETMAWSVSNAYYPIYDV